MGGPVGEVVPSPIPVAGLMPLFSDPFQHLCTRTTSMA